MTCFLGIDGGGTKTAYLLIDETGTILKEKIGEGISYKQYGAQIIVSRVLDTIGEFFTDLPLEDLASTVIGLPCLGEDRKGEEETLRLFHDLWPMGKYLIVNDAEIAAYGALGGNPGIHLVAGTGTIAWGIDEEGHSERSGGWSTLFSDEGSGTWLGKKALEIFTKEADLRLPRARLYDIFHEAFPGRDDMEICAYLEKEYYPYRDRLASLQLYLSAAAKQGDLSAQDPYLEAANEYALLISSLKKRLSFSGKIPVTTTGGIFRNGELVYGPLRMMLNDPDLVLKEPLFTPVQGACLMALREAKPEVLDEVREAFGHGPL